MHFELWLVGKTRTSWVRDGQGKYLDRLTRYARHAEVIVPAEKSGDPVQIVNRESERLLLRLKKSDSRYTILLDEHGVLTDSPGLAALIDKARAARGPQLRFIIGGAYGVNSAVRAAVDHQLALSRMTFPHELVRVLFLEQLYRAFTILRGESYHHS
ncbi:MAG: 23S rRNA (pseudouridine(1915)-N(3))-methyltransferase RlmH [Saprospiraceae bacterium]|nr:23S rRNA (pseudouridine(1915)-N(3))-methyltransferase RlmH [Saprospiraceae bacterium]